MNTLTKLPGLEACELSGAAADAVIDAAKPEELTLVPIEQDEFTQKLLRAGFSSKPSDRKAFRAAQND